MKLCPKWLISFLQLCFLRAYSQKSPPHIILIYADDLGWNDVSFHGSFEIPTPNIDALAMSGILLNNYYGYWLCSPSRAALLTGKHPIRLGLQHSVILPGEASGLPLNAVTLPQYLKKLGYETHMIGKWHLGYMNKEYTPTYRGFDSFFGYWNGYVDYYDYTHYAVINTDPLKYYYGIDLHNGTEVVKNLRSRYATEVFTEKAEEIIRNHDASKPLFLYLSHLAAHTGNPYDPLPVPPKYMERVKHIKEGKRRRMGGVISALDDSVGNVFKTLNQHGMLENSIFLFMSDNGALSYNGAMADEQETVFRGPNADFGAVSDAKKYHAGSNFPLRGQKETLWEGGNRLPALIWSPLFNLQKPRISNQLMHVLDWLPTLYRAAGGNAKEITDVDGVDMWEALVKNLPSPRKEILYNIDPIAGVSALRINNMKVINGTTGYDSWYKPDTYNNSVPCSFPPIRVEGSSVHDVLVQSSRWIIRDKLAWRKKAAVSCTQPPPIDNNGDCNPGLKPCLFDVVNDPCEYNNLADKYPEMVDRLMESILNYQNTAVAPQYKKADVNGNPVCYNFTYVPWMDPEYHTECPDYFSLT